MKNVLYFLIFTTLLLTACGLEDPGVRFSLDENVKIPYGIRYGKAQFGPLNYGKRTSYKDVQEGMYDIQILNEEGVWETITDSPLGPVEQWASEKKRYTIYIDVSTLGYTNYYSFTLDED